MSFLSPDQVLSNQRAKKIELDIQAMRAQIQAKLASADYHADSSSSLSEGGRYVYRRRGEFTLNVGVEPEAAEAIIRELRASGWTVEDLHTPGSYCHNMRIYY